MRETGDSSDFGKTFEIILTSIENKFCRPVQTHLPKRFQKVIDTWNDLFLLIRVQPTQDIS
jgi:hypothetical protein